MMKIYIVLLFIVALFSAPLYSQEEKEAVKTETEEVQEPDENVKEYDSEEDTQEADYEDDSGSEFNYRILPSLGITFQSLSQSANEEIEELQWLFNLSSSIFTKDENWQFMGSLFFQYGQLHSKGEFPEKTQDNLIISIMPSWVIDNSVGLQLFLETAGHTTVGKGEIDGYPTKFLDPLFLYQTIFLGQHFYEISDDEYTEFDLVYGIGYAFQQTITKDFVLEGSRDFEIDPDNPLSNVQDQLILESGYSAIVKFFFTTPIAENFIFETDMSFAAFTKDPAIKDIDNSTANGIITAKVKYSYFSLDYSFVLNYDKNLSPRRQLYQTLVLGLSLDL